MPKVFLDTNILVYSFDVGAGKKQSTSIQLIHDLKNNPRLKGVISTQVLQEFYIACVKKLGIEPLTAKGYLAMLANFEVVQVSVPLIQEAVDCCILSKISFWDALIVVSAKSAKCERIWTEDLCHGQIIRGVDIVNPLTG